MASLDIPSYLLDSFNTRQDQELRKLLNTTSDQTIADIKDNELIDLSDLGDVDIASLEDRDVFLYDQNTLQFINVSYGLPISVKEFGAVGDGVTDDTQSFIDAQQASAGRAVFVPSGLTYYLSSFVDGAFFTDGAVEFLGGGYAYVKNTAAQQFQISTSNTAPARWHEGAGGSVGSRSVEETFSIKTESEAPFDAVAVALVSYEATASTGYTGVVAATETFSTATQDSRYRPVVGGVTYNALRGSGDYGWDALTWDGASSVDLAAASLTSPAVAVSDFMPISSVPRADGGTRPLLLIRMYHNGTVNSHSFLQRDFSSFLTESQANRGRLFDIGNFLGNAVSSLASGITVGSRSFLMFPLFRYRKGVISVACVGDSISQGTGSAAGINNWCRRACADLSSTSNPVVPMNMGFASQTTATYLAQAKAVFSKAKPTIAFYSAYSPNDSISTNRGVQNAMARVADFVEFCNRNGIVPIITTPVPNNNLDATADAFRVAIKNNVLDMASNNSVIVADFASAMGTGALPDRFLPGLNSDNLHPNDAGYEVMAEVAKGAIIKAISGL